MTDAATIVAIGTAASAVIVASASVVVAVMNAHAQAKTKATLDKVAVSTDGNLTAIRNELALARQEIESLKTARGLAAVEKALATPTPTPVTSAPIGDYVEETPNQ